MKVVNREERWIGFRLHILGIRVWEDACQLVAKNGDQWVTLGPPRELPVKVPSTAEELKEAAADPLRLTAYQYVCENEGTDLPELLAKNKKFDSAMPNAGAAMSGAFD
jgi:hypothetical protein